MIPLRPVGLLMLLLGLALSGGCSDSGGKHVTVRFWNGFTGPDGRRMLELVRTFNGENPDIRVIMQRMDWYTYYNKLFVAGVGNRAPEVFVVHASNMPRFAEAGFLYPLDDLLAGEGGLQREEFSPKVLSSAMRDGRLYGVPLDVHTQAMYINADLFRAAGLVDEDGEPDVPTNREEFVEALERLTRDTDGDGRIDQWGFVFTNLRNNMLCLMYQFGGTFFTPDGTACTMNNQANIDALAWASGLIHEKKLVPSPENYIAWLGFRQGNVAMVFEGVYMMADLEKQTDLDYGAAPMPTLGTQEAVWAGSHILCLRKDLKETERKAAVRFVRFLSDHSLDWAEAGQIPARRHLLETPRFQDMGVQSVFASQLDAIRYSPDVPFNGEFETEFNEAVESALRGTRPADEALHTAAKNMDAVIERYHEVRRDL